MSARNRVCGARRPGTDAGPGRWKLPCFLGAGHTGVHRTVFGDPFEYPAPPGSTPPPPPVVVEAPTDARAAEYAELSRRHDALAARVASGEDTAAIRTRLRRLENAMARWMGFA